MKPGIYKNYHELSLAAANEIASLVKSKPTAVLCLASGDTPRLTCKLLAEKAAEEHINFSQCTFIGLDEWVGIPPENEGSCHYFFKHNLFDRINFSPANIHLFNALTDEPLKECAKLDKLIFEKGGIDLIIVGVGMNGHIGFNEPGVSFDLFAHVINLDDITIAVGQKYFSKPVALKQGITLGLKHLMQARKAILMANAVKKAEVIKRALEEPVSNLFPAGIITMHPNGMVMIDEEAASLLQNK